MESTPIGMVRSLAQTRMCDINAFRHHAGRAHRDPAAEQTGAPELILTTRGDWLVRTSASSGGVTVDCLVAIDGEQELQIRHEDREPQDSQVMITLKPALVSALKEFHQRDGRLFGLSHCGMNSRIDSTRRLLLDELAHDRPGRDFAIDNYVSALAVEALRVDRDNDSAHSGRLRDARDYLEAHLGEDIDLAVLANHAHLSPGHFARLFRAQYGLSPRDYLLRARMRRAAQLSTPASVCRPPRHRWASIRPRISGPVSAGASEWHRVSGRPVSDGRSAVHPDRGPEPRRAGSPAQDADRAAVSPGWLW